jgi:hypothetical protein
MPHQPLPHQPLPHQPLPSVPLPLLTYPGPLKFHVKISFFIWQNVESLAINNNQGNL